MPKLKNKISSNKIKTDSKKLKRIKDKNKQKNLKIKH